MPRSERLLSVSRLPTEVTILKNLEYFRKKSDLAKSDDAGTTCKIVDELMIDLIELNIVDSSILEPLEVAFDVADVAEAGAELEGECRGAETLGERFN